MMKCWSVRRLAGLLPLLALCACGPARDAFTVSVTALNYTGGMGGPLDAGSQDILVHVDDGPIYLAVLFDDRPSSPIASATLKITGDRDGRVLVTPKEPFLLGPGVYTGTLVIVGCLDENCEKEAPGSPKVITVTSTITPDLSASPTSLSFSYPRSARAGPAVTQD